ncbi:endonuclease/exonuclease/phosphatase family protein [Streptomyces montanisoli]|uniref:Endonuclease/exonuclease/phosphatase family protein n=1 Tax=Streptomyces montanisoli TaxID=2798581 RepID=A0A940RXR6_9ACTN|nr:endonuclease/exonuclease/phosphatase family protein [Streptomyces montanisoli]MBP0460855.1 endonuclease/exonuclease/phosphatase family protein [Streptomyces montanisoli]
MAMPPLPDSRTEPDGSAVIRVLTYNIRSMRDDRAALARVIRACAPDLVFVQEAPRFFRWRKYASWLARATDLVVLGGGATAAGPLLLCSLRATVESTRDVLLPRTPGLHRRGFATAVVRFGRARLGVLSCHLSLNAGERLDQAGKVLDQLKSMDAPHAVAAGDINEAPTGRAFRLLADQLQDGWATAPWGTEHTYGATSPNRRIDAVFATPGVEVLTCGVPAGLDGLSPRDLRRASDHLPVLATLRVPAP